VERTGSSSRGLRVVVLSALSGFMAPLVFISVIVLRRTERRVHSHYRHWNRRLQHEISRWS
jgi:hypothetical protein